MFFPSCTIDGDGRITGNDATKFFAMSKLSRPELKQVYKFFFSLFLSSVYWFDFVRVLVMFLNIESSDLSMIVFDLFNIYKSFLNEI